MGEVRVLPNTHPRYAHLLEWKENGVRKRKHLNGTRKEAQREAERIGHGLREQEVKRRIETARAGAELTDVEWLGVKEARAGGVDLLAAVRAAVVTRERDARSMTVAEVCAGRKAEAVRHRVSKHYTLELRKFLTLVENEWGARSIASLTPEEVTAFVFARPDAATSTLRKRRVLLVGLFEFAVRLGLMASNPAKLLKTPRAEASVGEIGILTPEEAQRYLQACADHAPALLAGEALGMFAGLRRAEVERLDWKDVKFAQGHIEVTAGKSKTRTRRLVHIEPALKRILQPLQKPAGRVWTVNARRLLDRVQKESGWLGNRYQKDHSSLRRWPKNALRHSFVSYHLAHYGEAARTAMQAGHHEAVLFQHYRELVTREDAAVFWEIRLTTAPGR